MRVPSIVGLIVAAATIATPLSGQNAVTPLRVRVTAAAVFDVPGQIHVDKGRIEGPALIGSDDRTVRARLQSPERLVTIPRPGTQLAGVAETIDADALEVRLDNSAGIAVVPLKAIRRVEIRERRDPRHHRVLWTVLSSVGAFWASTFVAVSQCFFEHCSDGWKYFIIGVPAATAVGTAGALRNERWTAVSMADLSSRMNTRRPTTSNPWSAMSQ